MIVLAIDTALGACQAAVWRDSAITARSEAMERGHGEALAPMVRALLAEAEISPKQLDRIAVTIGPGTFTGIRIGLAFAKGLGLALDRPVTGISTLEAIALRAGSGERPLLIANHGRGEEFYAGLYDGALNQLRPPWVARFDAIAADLPDGPLRIAGSAAEEVAQRLAFRRPELLSIPPLADIAAMAALAAVRDPPGHPPEPLYLRKPDVKPQADLKRTLKNVTAADAAALSAIHGEAFAEAWSQETIAGLIAMPGARAWLAIEGAEPAGFLLSRSAADETEILALGVRPVFRRRGIARQLVAALLAATRPPQRLFLEVAPSNAAAQALYRALGFRPAGTRRGYYARANAAPEDALILSRELQP
jgi:tRNA threonylcarbamoyl adenosine modification protein YeaZ